MSSNKTPGEIALDVFAELNLSTAILSLWVFRKSKNKGVVRYSAKWVDTSEELNIKLLEFFLSYQAAFSETIPYSVLAEPHQDQFLDLDVNLTHADLLLGSTSSPREEQKISNLTELENVAGYVVKLEFTDKSVYAVKKVDSSWKTKSVSNALSLIFRDLEMSVLEDRVFSISNTFDFFIVDGIILISQKKKFESLLDYSDEFTQSLDRLLEDETFNSIFESTNEISEAVGSNMLQLRRMEAVRQKGIYLIPGFLAKLARVNSQQGWGLLFAPDGKLIPTKESARLIVNVLLDHRLLSPVTEFIYDVPSTTKVT